jgi:holo-[acyl-carrier protein] synthase
MIYGIGTDICDVRRIRQSLAKYGDRFGKRVLSPTEYAVWQARTARSSERGTRYMATRFSAKEAFSKAVGMGIHMPMTWRRCEIANHPSGAPYVVLHGALKEWFDTRSLKAHISVTDETDYAASFCVIETAS